MTIDIVRGGSRLAEVVLTTVIVTEVLMTVNQVDLPQETVTFDFERMQLTYMPDGTPVRFCFNRMANGPC